VYCVPYGGKFVVAAAPTVECFGPEHLRVYIIAIIAIAASVVGFPLFAFVSLSRSAGWCGKLSAKRTVREEAEDDAREDDAEKEEEESKDDADKDIEDGAAPPAVAVDDTSETIEAAQAREEEALALMDPLKGPGPISKSICVRTTACVKCMVDTRGAFEDVHDKARFPATHHAWTAFTHSDYKPEFFFVRISFFISITALALVNVVLNPDFMLDAEIWTEFMLVVAQFVRFGVCVAAVMVPCILLIALLPMKTSSRWKLPLRVACAAVSMAMLIFNIASW
jgi:hypothetical protein